MICIEITCPKFVARLENNFYRLFEPQEPDAAAAGCVCVLVAALEQQLEKQETFIVLVA